MSSGKAKVKRTTNSSVQVETIVDYIDRLIGAGQLRQGDPVSEPEIGDALGVGRVPVREALRILAGEGVLELIPKRGAHVRIVSAQEVFEMLEVLTGLSVTAMHLLFSRPVSNEVMERINAASNDILKSVESNDAMLMMKKINIFHGILISNCGNGFLQTSVHKIRIMHYSRYLVQLVGLNAFKDAAPFYPRITAALEKRDSATAGRILLKSVERLKSFADGRQFVEQMHPKQALAPRRRQRRKLSDPTSTRRLAR